MEEGPRPRTGVQLHILFIPLQLELLLKNIQVTEAIGAANYPVLPKVIFNSSEIRHRSLSVRQIISSLERLCFG